MRISNRALVLNLLAAVAGMLLLTAASVPLYRIFCAATGYNGTTERAEHAPAKAGTRIFTVTFNADVHPGLPWQFAPEQGSMQVTVGKQVVAYFRAENTSDKPITGRAVYNVLPLYAGSYFFKTQCFCFTNQTLAPHQKVDMPVLFYIDPKVSDDHNMDGVKIITLSYTFFRVSK